MLRPNHWIWVFIVGAGILGTKAYADDTVVRSFAGGSAASMVGIVPASEDVELAGPQALSADGQGNLFVLDQINGRILAFDPKQPNSAPNVLKMPKDLQPTDLVVHNDDIMVWDGGVRTLKAAANQSTRGLGDEIQLEEVSSRGVDDQVAASAFAQMGSQPPGSATDLLDQNTRAAVIGQGRQPDRLAYRSERPPVSCACTKPGERLIMSRHRVALVIRESVAGVTLVEGPHDRVALDFRQDGGGRNAGGLGVAFNDSLLRDVDFLQPLRIDQQVLRRQP
jgi:hypothetical protein